MWRRSHLIRAGRDSNQIKIYAVSKIFRKLFRAVTSPRDDLSLFIDGRRFEIKGFHLAFEHIAYFWGLFS